MCKPPSEIDEISYEVRLPGESCDEEQYLYKCMFGRRRCFNGRCLGFSLDETCQDSRDCNPLFYCESNICINELKEGENCVKHIQCGRNMMCHKGGPGSYNSEEFGLCTPFFSIEDGISKLYF